jgi:signal-transduction protein with cAMP-binding, CBS, and nucleotidyltransferase domain
MALRPEFLQQGQMLLQGILLFGGTKPEHIGALLAELEVGEFKKGKVVIMEQEISKVLYILASGSVGIYRREKGEKKLVATLNAPNFFGETSMFTESAATALVKAEEDTRLFMLKKSSFDAVLSKYPELGPLVQKHIEEIKAARPPLVRQKPDESQA